MSAMKLVCLTCGQTNRVARDKPCNSAKCGICGARLMAAKSFDLTPSMLDKAARLDDLPLLVDFWAPWCGPCRMMTPEFSKAAKTLGEHVRFAKLNTQDHPEAGGAHGIRGIPTMILFDKGQERARHSGALRSEQIIQFALGK